MRENTPATPYTLFAEYYDLAWAAYAEYCRDVILAAEESALRPFRRVCDAACGTGVLLELLQTGDASQAAAQTPSQPADSGVRRQRSLLGFDRSAAMLRRARARLPGLPLRQADLRDPFPFAGPIDLVTCMHDSLNYLLEPDELLWFFTGVRRVLAPDGVLICDLNAPELYRYEAARTAAGSAEDYLLQGDRIRESMEYDASRQVGVTRLEFPAGIEVHRQRAYTSDEVQQLLFRAGLFVSDIIEVNEEQLPEGGARPSGKVIYVAVKAQGE